MKNADELPLTCLACGDRALLHGRWAAARVICTGCGWESPVEPYRGQIEALKERWCRETAAPEPRPADLFDD